MHFVLYAGTPVKLDCRKAEVHYIGATSCCGCDFPHAMLQNSGWPEIGYVKHLEQDLSALLRQALVTLLQTSGEKVVELWNITPWYQYAANTGRYV